MIISNIKNSIIQLLPALKLRETIGSSQGLIACMPKTGSTFLKKKLFCLENVRLTSYRKNFYRSEQELEEDKIREVYLRNLNSDLIAQHHVRCNTNTIQLINKYEIKTIVLIRNIKDILVSMSEHVENTSPVWPMYYLDEKILKDIKSNNISLLSAVTALCTPWLISFYLSWKKESKYIKKEFSPYFVNYDQLFSNKVAYIQKIADFLNFKNDISSIEKGLERNDHFTRFNKGISGRGKEAFEKDKVASIYLENVLSIYPKENFNDIKDII